MGGRVIRGGCGWGGGGFGGCRQDWKWGRLHREVESVGATPVIMFIYSTIDRPLNWPFWGLDTRMLTKRAAEWRGAAPRSPRVLTPIRPGLPRQIQKSESAVWADFKGLSHNIKEARLDDISWDHWKPNQLDWFIWFIKFSKSTANRDYSWKAIKHPMT